MALMSEDKVTKISAFSSDFRVEDGIYQALDRKLRLAPAQASNFLPLTAALYEPLWRKRSLSLLTNRAFSVERELKLMLEWLDPQPNQVILDAACSAALYARTLLKHEASLNVYALDFSLPFLKKAKDYAERDETAMVLVQADVAKLPFKDASFDAIVCGGSLNEFRDLPAVTKEFARVLKPKGKMWQMYLKPSEAIVGKLIQSSLRPSGISFIKPDQFELQCQENGLELLKAQHRAPVVMAVFRKV